MKYIIDRLSEASTWRGILAFATGVGYKISPDMQEQILVLGLSAIGMIGLITKDKK